MKRIGHTERLPSGRHRARRGKKTVGTFDTELEAEAALGGANMAAEWDSFVIGRRSTVRYVKNDESKWALYFEDDPIVSVPLTSLSRKDAKLWLQRMLTRGLSPYTVKQAIGLGRVFCNHLLELELIESNPFTMLKVPKAYSAKYTAEEWTVLDPDEQVALLDVVSDAEYHFVAFALHTGLRLSEIINLKTEDIDLDAGLVTVRRSKGGLRPKSGKTRKVPLIGLAIQAAEAAVERGAEYAFPTPSTGRKRFDGRPPYGWKAFLKAARFRRRVRFHDLRHTCATALLAGWWGRTWTLKEVQQIMGHAQQSTTERYAHMLDETVLKAGAETVGLDPTAWGDAPRTGRKASTSVAFGKRGFGSAFHRLALRRLHGRPVELWAGRKSRVIGVRWLRVGGPHWAGRKSRAAA